MNPIPAFWHRTANVGDTLTPVILDWLGIKYTQAAATDQGKLIGVGSILHALQDWDTVMGSGFISNVPVATWETRKRNLNILAVRGPLSEAQLGRDSMSSLWGDPALLLPLIYPKPPYRERAWKHKIGFVPHYVDEEHPFLDFLRAHRIHTRQPWQSFVDQLCECKYVNSSSLHGVIIAEAYGIPARWHPLSNKVIGRGFKFYDYYASTGRDAKRPAPLDAVWLKETQERLHARLVHYSKTGY